MTSTQHPAEAFALEPNELRSAARASRPAETRVARESNRLGVVAAVALGTICLLGAGFGAHEFMGVSAAKRSIKIGPLAEMPEIRNGVPDLLPRVRAAALSPAALPPVTVRAPAVEAANARAMALTIAAASLRPGLGARAIAAPPVPLAQVEAAPALPLVATAPAAAVDRSVSIAALPKPEPASAPIDARRPAQSVAIAMPVAVPAPPEPTRPEPATQAALAPVSLPPEPGLGDAPTPAPLVAPPLPPVRPAEIASARATEPARGADAGRPAEPARVGAVFRPIPAPKGASKPAQVVERAPPAGAPGTRPPASVPAEERAEILGVPLPSFVPTGRDIRDAANSIADAVTGLPSRF